MPVLCVSVQCNEHNCADADPNKAKIEGMEKERVQKESKQLGGGK